MLAAVKEEGLKFLGGARAGRSLKAKEKEAKVQKKSWREPGTRELAFPVTPSYTLRP